MARIRTTKPEFWTDGDVMDMSPQARDLFHGSWNFTLCDFGHLPDDPRRLKMQVIPADDVMMVRDASAPLGWRLEPLDPEALVDELIACGRFARIDVDGRSYLHVVRFTDHQRIDARWTPRCPVCKAEANHDGPRGNSREFPRTRRPSSPDRTGQDRTSAAAAAEKPQPPQHPADLLPAALDLLRSRLETQHRLFVRWDKLTPEHIAEMTDLIETHGDAALIKAALTGYRANDPIMFAQGWLSHWRQLRPAGHLEVVKELCPVHQTQLSPSGTCNGCVVDAKVGDR